VILDNCTVITMDAERRIVTDAAVAVVGRTIEAVDKSEAVRARFPDETIRDLRGWLVVPGLVDGHMHLPQALLRGAGDDVPLWVWMAERIFVLEGHFDAEDARVAARLAILEMLKAGTTAFLETLINARHDFAALAEAIDETGIRAALPRAVADGGGYLDESPLHPGLLESADEAIAEARAVAEEWRDSDRIHVWLGPRSTGGCSVELLRRLAELSREEGLPISHHFAMNPREVAYIRSRHGCTPGEYLERVALLGPNVALIHCVSLSDEDIDVVAGTGTSVVYCPSAPCKVGSGLAPVPEFVAAGINVGLGTDAPAANNAADLVRDLRWVGYLQKLDRNDATLLPRETILEMATLGGARTLGLESLIGSIEPGKRADLIVVRTDGAHWTPNLNPVSNLVYAASGADVDTVMIDGEVVMEGREMTRLDEEEILWEARRRSADLFARTGIEIPQLWPVV
jgi:cytosine/adenosine deaminase-related metal-dependent hydrolase